MSLCSKCQQSSPDMEPEASQAAEQDAGAPMETTPSISPEEARSIERDAHLIYNYHNFCSCLPYDHIDAVFCLCSLDTRVAKRAAHVWHYYNLRMIEADRPPSEGTHDGIPWLIFSGGSSELTRSRFERPEAEIFANIAISEDVPPQRIILETRSTNTGENIRFTWNLLASRGKRLGSFVLVQKPYMERRTYATFKKQWPDPTAEITVTSPPREWREYPNAENPRDLVINLMVGDLIRIKEYPAKGFQIHQDIPEDVWEAGQRLIAAGFDKHLPDRPKKELADDDKAEMDMSGHADAEPDSEGASRAPKTSEDICCRRRGVQRESTGT